MSWRLSRQRALGDGTDRTFESVVSPVFDSGARIREIVEKHKGYSIESTYA